MLGYYSFRWIYASLSSLLLFAAAFYEDLLPKYQQLQLANKTETGLQLIIAHWQQENKERTLTRLTNFDKGRALHKNNEEVNNEEMDQLVRLLKLTQLRIISLEVLSADKWGNIEAHLVVEGVFSQWLDFLAGLENRAGPVLLEHFSIKTGKELMIEMKIKLFAANQAYSRGMSHFLLTDHYPRDALYHKHNPFCATKALFTYPNQTNIHSVPLAQLKMVGFIQQGKKKQGILALADQFLFTVEEGSSIGKEQAKILALTAHQLEAQLVDGTRVYIPLALHF